MKKVIVSAFMLVAVSISTYAASANSTTPMVAAVQEDNKTKVDPATLPDAVKTTLAGDAYKGWTVTSAWAIKADPLYYTVELTKDNKTNTVNIDANGKVK